MSLLMILIAVGEDGPTHEPIEHLAGLRAIPNLNVFRPADARETQAAWYFGYEKQNYTNSFWFYRVKT